MSPFHRLVLAAGFCLMQAGVAGAAERANPAFGDAVQLAPFAVNGKKLSIAIHARTPADRKYAEKFAEEVVEIAYETMGDANGKGLVIVGREGEPHPVAVLRRFVAMAAAGELDPAVAAKAAELTAMMADWKAMLHLEEDPKEKGFKLTFDMIVPALPLPLEGLAAQLYQLSWAEDFDEARVGRTLRSLTAADLGGTALAKYTWVFYLPPRSAFKAVETDVIQRAVKHEKMGLLKRAALKSALVVFSPAVKTAVEAMRKGMLYMPVLRAESGYSKDDIMALTSAYTQVLMPDFKFNGGTEHRRALEAIEAQKVRNAEYAKDPFVSPPRLAIFEATAYAPFEGDYTEGEGRGKRRAKTKAVWSFKRQDGGFVWLYQKRPPQVFHPAGDRLFVSEDGKTTLQFQLDDQGAVTGVEARMVRHRRMFLRRGLAAGG